MVQALNAIKETASNTNDQPIQIIQNAVSNMSQESYSSMPNRQALRKQINRIRSGNMPSQPRSLQDINIPVNLCTTINGDRFLAKELEIGDEKMIIFCTTSNLQHLQEADYWMMDGTFKTVPTLFMQMYTIHAPVGGINNARVFPLVYTLMTNKTEESYKQLFQELINLGEESGYNLSPPMILTDFEQAAINATHSEFPESINKGCFFHLCQNLWKKIQALGLATEYGNNEDFSLKMRHITALAFLPPSEIPPAFDQIKPLLPSNAEGVIKYFEENYIYGRVRRQLRNGAI